MEKKDNGGPAFPTHFQDEIGGMSMRDWFAGQFLSGLTAATANAVTNPDVARQLREIKARDCYRMADAMLAARKQ